MFWGKLCFGCVKQAPGGIQCILASSGETAEFMIWLLIITRSTSPHTMAHFMFTLIKGENTLSFSLIPAKMQLLWVLVREPSKILNNEFLIWCESSALLLNWCNPVCGHPIQLCLPNLFVKSGWSFFFLALKVYQSVFLWQLKSVEIRCHKHPFVYMLGV